MLLTQPTPENIEKMETTSKKFDNPGMFLPTTTPTPTMSPLEQPPGNILNTKSGLLLPRARRSPKQQPASLPPGLLHSLHPNFEHRLQRNQNLVELKRKNPTGRRSVNGLKRSRLEEPHMPRIVPVTLIIPRSGPP